MFQRVQIISKCSQVCYLQRNQIDVGGHRIAVLVTYSPQNGVILLVIAFLVSPLGLPLAAVWLVGKVQDLRYAIQDAVYG